MLLFKNLKRTGVSAIVISGLITGFSGTAYAGFGWTPPVAVPAPATTVPGMQTIPAQENVGPLTPDPDTQQTITVKPAEPAPAVPVTPVTEQKTEQNTKEQPQTIANIPQEPLVIDNTVQQNVVENVDTPSSTIDTNLPIPITASSSPTTDANINVVNNAIIDGFGSDIPLVIALRDIVPAGYAFAFADSGMAGTKISWQGGKAWTSVLSDSLSAKGMVYNINGNVITINMGITNVPEVATDKDTLQTYSAKTAELDISSVKEWKISPGSTLHEALDSWCKTANVKLEWVSPYDFPISNAFVYKGNFTDALNSLLVSFAGETPRPTGKFYPNKEDGTSSLTIN